MPDWVCYDYSECDECPYCDVCDGSPAKDKMDYDYNLM